MQDPAVLERMLGARLAAVRAARDDVRADQKRLPVVFPGLPRKVGKDAVGGGQQRCGDATIDLDAWRQCDHAAALLLLQCAPGDRALWDDALWDLYEHGDIEERAMLLRALHLLPLGPWTVRLLAEVQRTNMVLHVEAACCDGDLVARAAQAKLPGFGAVEQNRLLLKLAFLDLPLRRVFLAERLANTELSRMLQDLATEREAAGRAVWRDTDRMLGRAPVPGTTARMLGSLEHGDDGRRLAAAEGLLALDRKDLLWLLRERLPRESRADVKALLQRIVG